MRTKEAYESTINELQRVVGLRYLKGAHLNDSKTPLGSRVDRHQSIGKGELGLAAFGFLMNDRAFEEIPLILETIDESLWPLEITTLYKINNPDSDP